MSDTTEKPAKRASRADWVILALLGLSLTVNLIFAIAFYRFTTRLRTSTTVATGQSRPANALAEGTVVPPLDVQRVNGERERIAYDADQRPTVIYVFTPTCVWCERNLTNLKTVLAAGRQSYRMIGLSLAPDVQSYLADAKLDLPVYVRPSQETLAAYGFGTTPQTVVVSPEGKVMKAWTGAYLGPTGRDVEAFFRVKLPGFGLESAKPQSSPRQREGG